ncbi:MAG: NAD(P)/FAD-dependent oxidoreductase, partial [Desulfuromonadales bacterium]|nr:NAD(P)/FAD-dependent oxidoreductase [Desulfuromonadales bacterium]
HGIEVRTEPLLRLEGVDGQLERVIFAAGEPLPRRGLFFLSEPAEHSLLPQRLGCEMVGGGQAATGKLQETGVPGLFLAGDAAKAVKLAVIAAAEGAEAAFAINTALSRSEFL